MVILKENLDNWSGKWIHYSNVPTIKINPNPYHQDPLGIYLFPEEFSTIGHWSNYKYKFTVTLKPLNVLDMASMTDDILNSLVDKAGVSEKYKGYIEQYPGNLHKRVDQAWEIMSRHYAYENGDGKRLAGFNKLFRSCGYDAIFDDIKAVHNAEVQMILLDPRKIESVSLTQKSGSGFNETVKVMNDVENLCRRFDCEIERENPKKIKDRWTDKSSIQGTITMRKDKDYIVFAFGPEGGEKSGVPEIIYANVRYSNPSLGYGCGVRYLIDKKQYDKGIGDKGDLDDLERAIRKVFKIS
jgi:hypothetical protein